MKTIMKLWLVAALMLMGTATISAQNNKRQRLTREELADKQARHIAQTMAFDDATTKQFVETYTACQKEIWALGPRMKGARKQANAQQQTESEAKQDIALQFERSEKLLQIRQKYYAEYSKFLTQNQIKRVYVLERRMMKRLANHRPARKPGQRQAPQMR
mgnify:FL=1